MAHPKRPERVPEPGPVPLAGSGGMQPPAAPPAVATVEPAPRPRDSEPGAVLVGMDGDALGCRIDLWDALEIELVIVATGQRATALVRRGQVWFAGLVDGNEVFLAPGALLQAERGTMRFVLGPNLDDQLHQLAYERACKDEDTDAFGRAYFDAALRQDVSTAHRLDRPLGLILLRFPTSDDAEPPIDRLRELVTELGTTHHDRVMMCRFDRRTLAVLVFVDHVDELEPLVTSVLDRARQTSELATAISFLEPGQGSGELLARALEQLG